MGTARLGSTALLALLVLVVVAYILRWFSNPLRKIPTVGGPSAPLVSYWGAFNVLRNPRMLLSEGYERYYGSAFKVSRFDQWLVVVSGPRMIDDIRKRPDDELSSLEGNKETLQTRFTLGHNTDNDPYHLDIIRDKLMRSIDAVLPDVIDEMRSAVPAYIRLDHDNLDSWAELNITNVTKNIIARASSRVFVGIPACHNQAYLNLAIKYTIDLMRDAFLLNWAPSVVRPFLAQYFSATRRTIHSALHHLKPLLDERRAEMGTYGDDYPGKPNDMLQWVLEEAVPRGSPDYEIVERVMLVNFSATHTVSVSISHALLHLAAEPKYLKPLRDEVEAVISVEGWTKAAMGKLWNIDSFLKESQRVNGVGLVSGTRKALQDTTLVDGTFIPKGTTIVTAMSPTHYDERTYKNASVFDPFRFARMRAAEAAVTKHHLVHVSHEYLAFGYGKHACPGRFFAAIELKAMLAYIVLNYDLKLPGDGLRPKNVSFGLHILVPDPKATVLFRRRQNAV
ncbi:cytochrome P450 [Polyporus arcularius HHB13444]|uniref:Cytochrome P450 n=1 Tax=Polyporus arcularius HHB13444 TaxID=1314778 RepID=A0A5C3NQI4_9APHY|nr:cytochrome P450 [Polyporus arcularius HHB13444]